jgi:hypothetical protein
VHWQAPLVHVAPEKQEVPQPPQNRSSVCTSTHWLEQIVVALSGHAHAGGDPLQVAPVGHATPQAPQFASSVRVFTQAVGVPAGHASGSVEGQAQVPPAQTSFASGQTFLHPAAPAPQFCGSWRVSAQYVPQSWLAGATQPQAPRAHPSPGLVHAIPHPPQFAGSFCASTQRGFPCGQGVAAASHWHAPAEHVPRPQATPQAPQLSGSDWKNADSRQTWLQRVWPLEHTSSSLGQPAEASASERRRAVEAGSRRMRRIIRPDGRGGRAAEGRDLRPAADAAERRVAPR